MLGLLRHRLIVAGRGNETTPIWGLCTANRADIEEFIEGRVDEARLERLLYALCLIAPAKHDIDRRHPPDFRETVFGLSRVWVSSTPYLCARHPKRDDKDSPRQQIKRECEQRGMPEVEVTDYNPQGAKWLEYQRRRWRKDMPPGAPQGFRLEFAEPVLGPLSLGANSHFGMGRFVPGQS